MRLRQIYPQRVDLAQPTAGAGRSPAAAADDGGPTSPPAEGVPGRRLSGGGVPPAAACARGRLRPPFAGRTCAGRGAARRPSSARGSRRRGPRGRPAATSGHRLTAVFGARHQLPDGRSWTGQGAPAADASVRPPSPVGVAATTGQGSRERASGRRRRVRRPIADTGRSILPPPSGASRRCGRREHSVSAAGRDIAGHQSEAPADACCFGPRAAVAPPAASPAASPTADPAAAVCCSPGRAAAASACSRRVTLTLLLQLGLLQRARASAPLSARSS